MPTPRLEREHGVSNSHPGDVTVVCEWQGRHRESVVEEEAGRWILFVLEANQMGRPILFLKIPIKPQQLGQLTHLESMSIDFSTVQPGKSGRKDPISSTAKCMITSDGSERWRAGAAHQAKNLSFKRRYH